MFRLSFALLASTLAITASARYELVQDYTGQNFFANFDFYNGPDPTNGHVDFVGDATSNKTGLAGLVHYSNSSTPSDVVFLGVDNSTVLPVGKGRRSLRMQSVQTFNQSLVIADILHQPSNVCGVWPAFWMLGTSATWPAAGEIDILEGVNDMNHSRISMHTTSGLTVSSHDSMMSGKMKTSNCDVAAVGQDQNVGCMVDDAPATHSYGAGFNAMQGGVFAMEYTTEAVKVWFFNRTRIPDDIVSGKPQPPSSNGSDFHAWGKPTAMFAPDANTTQSALATHLKDLQIIFDTTFCGDWAGKVWNTSSCAQLAPTCEQYVSQNPNAFNETYWLIKSLQVFQQKAPNTKRSLPGGYLPSAPEEEAPIPKPHTHIDKSQHHTTTLPTPTPTHKIHARATTTPPALTSTSPSPSTSKPTSFNSAGLSDAFKSLHISKTTIPFKSHHYWLYANPSGTGWVAVDGGPLSPTGTASTFGLRIGTVIPSKAAETTAATK